MKVQSVSNLFPHTVMAYTLDIDDKYIIKYLKKIPYNMNHVHYGEAGIIGMEVTRWPEKSKYLHTQDNINALFNHYSSSTG